MKVEIEYWRTNAEYQEKPPYGVKITGKSLVKEEVKTIPSDFGGYYYFADGCYHFAHLSDPDLASCRRMILNDSKNMKIKKYNEDLSIIEE